MQAHPSELIGERSEAEAKEQLSERARCLAASNNVAADSSPRPASNGDKSHNLKKQVSKDGGTPPDDDDTEGSEGDPEMLLQLETRSISHEQLVIEVKGLYAGLVIVEAECIDIDERLHAAAPAAAQEEDSTASKEKDIAQATIGHNTRDYDGSHSIINPGTWLRGGFQPNDSETDATPRNLEGQMLTSDGPPPDDDDDPEGPEREPEMLLQPETPPISHEQLVINERDLAKREKLTNDQWQSLIALHKKLLYEHHDFFLASQHPSASPVLRRLAAKYSMPARMWRHGIHAILEVLRHRLPDSLEHMLAFIYIAYTIMALLYETVSAFEGIWTEGLGDLGRYRMAIEDDPKERKVWNHVARFWYNKSVDQNPTLGRLYYHLAILARPYSLEQLSLYTRSLTCITPYESARENIMTLFKPILQGKDTGRRQPPSFETVFIRIHGILFISQLSGSLTQFDEALKELENGGLLDNYISKPISRLKEKLVHAAVSNIAALFEYGTPQQGRSRLCLAYQKAQMVMKEGPIESNVDDSGILPSSTGSPKSDTGLSAPGASAAFISYPSRLAFATLAIFLKNAQDNNIYPLLHVYLTFIWSLVIVQQSWSPVVDETIWKIIEKDIPWDAVCSFLNTLLADPEAMTARVWAEDFPKQDKPLPEDFVIRGQLYTWRYFPPTWFTEAIIDDDERDSPLTVRARKERLLWLGNRIASADRWIRYNVETKSFRICLNESLNRDVKSQPQSSDRDTTISESDFAQYTPSELSDGTASNAPSEWHDDCTARSTGGLQNETRNAELVHGNETWSHLQLSKSGGKGDQSHLQQLL